MQATEHQHQAAFFQWAKMNEKRMPELKWMFAVPNAAKRSPKLAAMMKAEGLKSGVPDVIVPFPSGDYCGLAIEMKSSKGRISDNQKTWLAGLKSMGWMTATCIGWEAATKVVEEYYGV